MKHYYAEKNMYGILVSYSSFGGPGRNGYTFHRFDTKEARDKWVLDNQYDRDGNIVAGECSRRTVEYNLGKNFRVTPGGYCFGPHNAWLLPPCERQSVKIAAR